MNGSSSGSPGIGRFRQQRPWAGLAALLALLALLLLPGRAMAAKVQSSSNSSARTTLQEVAPPPAVRQLQQALAERAPRLDIVEPGDDTLLPDGPWTLKLRVDDWPLVDAGPLGLGPHLVVQLDDEPPRRLTSLETTLPALSPGSHRLTVFAARPWGEAVKNPGAVRQIRLHRLAANPLSLPPRGTPQLIAVSPAQPSPTEPLLLDWLLIDAPLQNLRSGDAGWRLRVTINGDSVLLDRQTPLWLQGWRPGLNSLQLELLDGRGEPLNPPFNSLVTGVSLDRSSASPGWRERSLPPLALAQLLGEAPVSKETVVPDRAPEGDDNAAPPPQPAAASPPAAAVTPESEAAAPASPQVAVPSTAPVERASTDFEATAEPDAETVPEPDRLESGSPPVLDGSPQPVPRDSGGSADNAVDADTDNADADAAADDADTDDAQPAIALDPLTTAAPQTPAEPQPEPEPGTEPDPGPESEPVSRPVAARDLVNPDGTLIQPPQRSLLSGLRSRFGR